MGQLLIAGFDGHQIPAELRSIAREFSLGGVILFARNVTDPEQVAELSFEASQLVPDLPVWISVDQEGGRVARLKALGVTLDYAPVLDILTNPKNPVIGDRALGERAEDVARLGSAVIRTLQDEGLAACGKHFP